MGAEKLQIGQAVMLLREYGAELVSGKAVGLDNPIEGVSFRDSPSSSADLLSGGELILTNTAELGKEPDFRAMMEEMARCRIAGLLVYILDPYEWAQIRAEFLQHADEAGIPVLTLPKTAPYASILETVYRALLQHPVAVSMEDYGYMVSAFARILVKDHPSFQDVSDTLSRLLQADVAVSDIQARMLAASILQQHRKDRVALLSSIPALIPELEPEDGKSGQLKYGRQETAGQIYYRAAARLNVQSVCLFIWSDQDYSEYDWQSAQIAVLEAEKTISFLQKSTNPYDEAFGREVRELYEILLFSEDPPDQGTYDRLIRLLPSQDESLFAIAVSRFPFGTEDEIERFTAELRRGLNRYPGFAWILRNRSEIVIMFHSLKDASARAFHGILRDRLQQIAEHFRGVRQISIALGEVQRISGTDSLRESLTQVRKILFLAERIGERGLLDFPDYALYLLLDADSRFSFREMCRKSLGRISDSLGRNAPVFLDTLEAYYDCGESLQKTAKLLKVHVNTVRYRLEKAGEVLNAEGTGAGKEWLHLYLLLKMRRLL